MDSGSTLVAIQLSRNLLLVVNVPIHASFDHMQIFAHGTILIKFWEANARAQAKVARACAQVCWCYTTGYHLCDISTYLVRGRGLQTKECVQAASIHLLEFQSAKVCHSWFRTSNTCMKHALLIRNPHSPYELPCFYERHYKPFTSGHRGCPNMAMVIQPLYCTWFH